MKIILSAIIKPFDGSMTADDLTQILRRLGSTEVTYAAEVEEVNLWGMDASLETWVYASADEGTAYLKVAAPGETEGEDISQEELDFLTENGVCVEFNAEYPRADKYGTPLYASKQEFAEGVVGSHCFRVPSDDGLVVQATDRGDDGLEQLWLKIVSPPLPVAS